MQHDQSKDSLYNDSFMLLPSDLSFTWDLEPEHLSEGEGEGSRVPEEKKDGGEAVQGSVPLENVDVEPEEDQHDSEDSEDDDNNEPYLVKGSR